jgi:ABC-2 type transport system permease protein
VTAPFLRQLRWELRRLWRRPRTYLGFGAALAFEVALLALMRLPAVREHFIQRVWTAERHLGIREPFSALSNAVEVLGQTMLFIGAVAIAMVGAEIVGREIEDGTLRMALARPVSRTSVFFQKLLATLSYVTGLTLFVGTTVLAVALLFEPLGQLIVVSARDGVIGIHEPSAGFARYAFALALLVVSMCTPALLALMLACLPMRATTAAMVTVTVILGDWIVHTHPVLALVSPYTLMTRVVSWRQVFNQAIPWGRLDRNYGELVLIDAVLVAIGWLAFRRRALT